jgi:hypothetical protein
VSDKGRFEKSFDYLGWPWLPAAVLAVYHENQRKEEENSGAVKANSDAWAINSRLRKYVRDRALYHWCKLTEYDETYFPASKNGVARIYMRIRKRQRTEIEAFDDEIKDAIRGQKLNGSLFGGE